MAFHLVRFGALGALGRFKAVDATVFPRRSRVVLRTERGLELGEVLSPPGAMNGSASIGHDDTHGAETERVELDAGRAARGDGVILRGMTPEDALLESRLEKNRRAAFLACERRMLEMQLAAALVDVEHLFDGRTLCFYFLGETSPQLDAITSELAELYEAQAQMRRFAETLIAGCGPNCGGEDGEGCQSCATGCAVAGACGTKPRRASAAPGKG
jgi:hypothetical protein